MILQYKGYSARFVKEGSSGPLHGVVVGIKDVITFQGDDYDQVEKAFHDSVDDYLEFCKERGEEPNKPDQYLADPRFIAANSKRIIIKAGEPTKPQANNGGETGIAKP